MSTRPVVAAEPREVLGKQVNALRRQGIGVIQIMRQRNLGFSLAAVVDHSLSRFDGAGAAPPDTAGKILTFIEGRMASILVEEGLAKDTVAAVLGLSLIHI